MIGLGGGSYAAPAATTAAPKVQIAPVALMIDLVRVVPGREDGFLSQVSASDRLMFNVLGEWDVLRLSLVTSFFPRPKNAEIWPPLSVPIHNQHSFLAHIWLDDNGCLPSALAQGEDGEWSFSTDFSTAELPVTLLLCVKLNPFAVSHAGVVADRAAVRYLAEKARVRRLLILPAGSIGWQEIIFVVRSRSFSDARELVRDACEAPLSCFLQNLPEGYGNQAMAARTITYPCTSLQAYLSPESDARLQQETCRARLLLNIRPGAPNPLRQDYPLAGFATPPYQQASELFGDYDLELNFTEPTPLSSLLGLTRRLRQACLTEEYREWITATSTVLDFAWDPATAPSRSPLTFGRIEAGISPFHAPWAADILRSFRWAGVEAIHSERLLAIFRHVISYSTDPLLADSVAPLNRFFSALMSQMAEFKSQLPHLSSQQGEPRSIAIDPNDIDLLCSLLEFSLRQRSEGLQQFLFNGLPSSYYGRGGLNRLLVGADAILQEVSGIFNIITPGFVVFGIPDVGGFASYGPIVIGPIPALFKLERWWVLYHEAGLYIEDHLFQLGSHDSLDKLVGDIITLSLPFQFDLELLSLMAAEQLATFQLKPNAYTSVAVRLGLLVVLRAMVSDLAVPNTDTLSQSQLLDLAVSFEERARVLAAGLTESVTAQVDAFLERFFLQLQDFTPLDQVDRLPRVDLVQVHTLLSAICSKIEMHCTSARRDRKDLFLATGLLVEFLLRRVRHLRRSAEVESLAPGRDIAANVDSIADLVHAAMRRWQKQLSDPKVKRTKDAPHDVQDRLADSLSVWHKGITEQSHTMPGKGGPM